MQAEVQCTATGVADRGGGAVDDLLDDGTQAATPGRVAHRAVGPQQGAFADQTKAVVGQRSQAQHGVVGVEPAGRQAFEVEVGLELAVELLVGAVIGIERDDLSGGQLEGKRPPTSPTFLT